MVFNRTAGGHAFDFDRGVCLKCGITRERYEDSGEPRCSKEASPAPGVGAKRSSQSPIDDDEN